MARSNYAGFSTVELQKPPRSMFDLSHEKRMSLRMGWLVPFFVSETLPNDTFQVNSEVMLRLAPMIAPIMHRVNVTCHFFFVPNRLLWEDWEAFITGGNSGPGVDTAPVPPSFLISDILASNQNYIAQGSLADYLGLKPIPDADVSSWGGGRKIDVMPFAACYKAWYDYYRDRNFELDEDYDFLPLTSGAQGGASPLLDAMLKLKPANWQKEMFTSALPWTQRGSQVLIPMEAAVNYADVTRVYRSSDGTPVAAGTAISISSTTAGVASHTGYTAGDRWENIESIENSSVTINDFRRALALQSWMERNAIGGTRLNETIYAHFARRTSDGRLQQAEYLGGGRVAVKVSEVITTAFSSDDTSIVPPGNMAGHGISFGNTNRFRYNCEEWGFIIGFMSVAPTPAYMDGAPRMFFGRNSFLDYAWPSFATLGEQPVYTYELYAYPGTLPANRADAAVFGYQSRYIDWKYIQSSSHGDFRSTLDYWHLTRKFEVPPVLNAAFGQIEDDLQDRVFAVSDVDTLWVYLYNNARVVRSLPYFGTPKLRG